MAGYRVVCVVIDYDSPHDDCRCVEALGFRSQSGGTITRTPAEVYGMIEEAGDTVVVDYREETLKLVAATRDGTRYVRTEDEDTAEDALLNKQTC